jgi:hypothetical protein
MSYGDLNTTPCIPPSLAASPSPSVNSNGLAVVGVVQLQLQPSLPPLIAPQPIIKHHHHHHHRNDDHNTPTTFEAEVAASSYAGRENESPLSGDHPSVSALTMIPTPAPLHLPTPVIVSSKNVGPLSDPPSPSPSSSSSPLEIPVPTPALVDIQIPTSNDPLRSPVVHRPNSQGTKISPPVAVTAVYERSLHDRLMPFSDKLMEEKNKGTEVADANSPVTTIYPAVVPLDPMALAIDSPSPAPAPRFVTPVVAQSSPSPLAAATGILGVVAPLPWPPVAAQVVPVESPLAVAVSSGGVVRSMSSLPLPPGVSAAALLPKEVLKYGFIFFLSYECECSFRGLLYSDKWLRLVDIQVQWNQPSQYRIGKVLIHPDELTL